jgi:predicted O-linked N-acetylglucosamine transferase (SPINDLY family)
MPIFANHDPQKIEVTCYSNSLIQDEVTEKLRGFVPQWRSIFSMSDADAARLIQKDEIDILVDLSGHTSGNRLPLFTLKPAPIQTSYLGYPTTTGLSAMDYRITDAWADPIGASDQMHTEKLIRLDGGFLCYQPPDDAPNVGPAPCLENEYITFGSCNNLAKLTPQVIKVWARILQAVPHTKLLLKAKALGDKAVRDRLINAFTNESIDKERLILRSWITKKSPLSIYNEIDIALDPFPYNGTTTLCETLWMGVPTIVLEGRRHSARVGHSLNSQVGLQGWTAPDIDGYVTLATLRANDVSNLRRIRESVRDQMKNSSLCDGLAFTARLELAYAKMCKN